jgi:two-component system response regulator AtoC
VVDDAEGIRGYLASLLELRGFDVDTAEDGPSALALLEARVDPDLILLDVMMPGLDGLETLRRIREKHPEAPVVMLSVVGKARTIVDAMQLGAADYLNKPFEEEDLVRTIHSVLERRVLEEERDRLAQEIDAQSPLWEGPELRKIRDVIAQVADTDVTVLVTGESGVGKEVVARAVHSASARVTRPFVKVNCAALPEDLLESELFGYEKGAFTGAIGRKLGKFEVAHTGTIFLDEIGEMSPALQAKLLQVLQDGEFTRIGGNREVRVDVRVITATNRPLDEMVRQGRFREDLFFRLNVVNLAIPPLRERREEVPTLVSAFLARYCAKYRKPRRQPSARLMKAFERYPFPGNVRELENMIKRVVVLENEASILAEIVGGERLGLARRNAFLSLLAEVEETAGDLPLREVGRRASLEVERETIERVLYSTNWNRKQAARILNVSYKTLLQKIRECGLDKEGGDVR